VSKSSPLCPLSGPRPGKRTEPISVKRDLHEGLGDVERQVERFAGHAPKISIPARHYELASGLGPTEDAEAANPWVSSVAI